MTLLTVSVGLPPTVPLAAGETCTGVPSTTCGPTPNPEAFELGPTCDPTTACARQKYDLAAGPGRTSIFTDVWPLPSATPSFE